jgi:thiol-disulfide isomerase/thioredoxin
MNLKSIFKDIAIFAIVIIVASNAISYFRAPNLESVSLDNISGKLLNDTIYINSKKSTIVYFWATWCPICKLESSNVESISNKYNVISIAVNSKSNKNIIEYMKKNNLHFNTINDENGALSKKFKIKAFPTILIYDKNKNLIFTEVGYTSYIGLLLRMIWI